MKCKGFQTLASTGTDLPKAAVDHVGGCPTCQKFLEDVAVLDAAIPSLDAVAPPHLRSRIQDRIARPGHRLDWRALAISAAIVAIVTTPIVQVVAKRVARQYVKGDRIGSLPPFHAKFYGKNHMSVGDEATGEVWFSGFAIRLTTPGLDNILNVERGTGYQHWKPGGVAEKRLEKWAATGKPVTATELKLLLDRMGPVAPAHGVRLKVEKGVFIRVFGHDYRTEATTYRLPVSKKGSLTSVSTPTNQVVYQDLDSGQIVRVELVAEFPGGIRQTETHDYEYVVPSDDKFETATLTATQTSTPAQSVPVKNGKRTGGG